MDFRQNYNYWKENVDKQYLAELDGIADDEKEIKERFTLPLAFGTAGMRGTIAMGISNMNVYTVARASLGLGQYIKSLGVSEMQRGVVISYDTRRKSFEFALTTARVLGAMGINVKLFEDVRPVPMCSFAVRHFGAIAGVMITASHNPKEYNGYKVYGEDGAQMSPEATAVVVDFISKADYFGIAMQDIALTDRADFYGKDNFALSDQITIVGKSVDEEYFKAIEKLSLSPQAVKQVGGSIKIVYSPIHGSGYKPVTAILGRMGIKVNVVEEQKEPDTEFSTVSVPNPEQPEALQMGIALANNLGSDIVIGTDPDADRMGIAIRDNEGKFILLNGNQIGAMLMDYILSRHQENGTMPPNPAVVKTIVTTHLADRIARNYGVRVYDVLTGFKFIGEKIKEWETSGESTFLFGYEESYGYLSGTHARDKDAVVASMLFAEMVCYYTSIGVGLYDKLISLFDKYGYFVEKSKSIVFKGLDGMDKMAKIMQSFRDSHIESLAGVKVVSKTDLNVGKMWMADGTEKVVELPKANVVKWDLGNDEWACVRPSGTEPKLKIYVSTTSDSKAKSESKNEEILKAIESMID